MNKVYKKFQKFSMWEKIWSCAISLAILFLLLQLLWRVGIYFFNFLDYERDSNWIVLIMVFIIITWLLYFWNKKSDKKSIKILFWTFCAMLWFLIIWFLFYRIKCLYIWDYEDALYHIPRNSRWHIRLL